MSAKSYLGRLLDTKANLSNAKEEHVASPTVESKAKVDHRAGRVKDAVLNRSPRR